MSTGNQGSADVTITLDDAGGTGRTMTSLTMTMGGAKIVVENESSDTFGEAWKQFKPTGIQSSPDIPISGMFETTATTGAHAVLTPGANDIDPNAAGRTLVIVFGDSKTFTVEVLLADYEVVAEFNKLTRFNATLRPTGEAAWS
jgi:hypothetical protein